MNTIKKKKGEKGRPDLITALTLLVTFFLKKTATFIYVLY